MALEPKHYTDSEELIRDVKKSIPELLYKYRDWENEMHAKTLKDATIWFSNPKTLNDPFDIRVPYVMDYSEVGLPEFYQKATSMVKQMHPDLVGDAYALKVATDNFVDLIKKDPEGYFERNMKDIRNNSLWDEIGLFSLSTDPLNEVMWAHYGNNGKGFCIGYDAQTLFLTGRFSCGAVDYRDEPVKFSLIKEKEQNSFIEQFIKSKKWEYEKEYRFLTIMIKQESDRLIKLNRALIKEVILGKEITEKSEQEIINCLKHDYASSVKLFRIEYNLTSYGYQMFPIEY